MKNFIIISGIIWLVASVGVPMLKSWELPSAGIQNTAQAAQLAQVE